MRQYSNEPSPIEKIISAASYLTAGMAGFIWIIVAAFMKKNIKSFLMYHIMQSIFLSIAYFLFMELYKLTFIAFAKIPLFNVLIFCINVLLFNPLPIFWGLSLLQVLTSGIILYLAVTSFMGMYSYVPFVSDIIRGNTNTK